LPDLVEIGRIHKERGGEVITIAHDLALPDSTADEALAHLRIFAKKSQLDAPIFLLKADQFDAVIEHFDIPGPIPYTIALDRQGKEVDTQEGSADLERFDEMMRRALGEGN
jgi:hypothetical protein